MTMLQRIGAFFGGSPASLPGHRFIRGVSHVNIGVPDLGEAIAFYGKLLDARPIRSFPRFRNAGFARSAGFLERPEDIEVSIAFLEIPGAGLTLELMQYHSPAAEDRIARLGVNDIAGVRHIALKVVAIDEAFSHVAAIPGVRLINPSAEYRPFRIDGIAASEFQFHDPLLEADAGEKAKVAEIVGRIRYFYFVDPYGVQWEFEQGHDDMGH
ncbi:MAG: VOC family protein [Hyphomicrobiales bacterium]